jgi:hypothetical protein
MPEGLARLRSLLRRGNDGSNRYGWTTWGPHGERKRTSEANWRKPLQWAKAARGTGKRPRVFCASLADWLDNQVPKEWRMDLYGA